MKNLSKNKTRQTGAGYTKEFKEAIIDDYSTGKKTVSELSSEYGVSASTIYSWTRNKKVITGKTNKFFNRFKAVKHYKLIFAFIGVLTSLISLKAFIKDDLFAKYSLDVTSNITHSGFYHSSQIDNLLMGTDWKHESNFSFTFNPAEEHNFYMADYFVEVANTGNQDVVIMPLSIAVFPKNENEQIPVLHDAVVTSALVNGIDYGMHKSSFSIHPNETVVFTFGSRILFPFKIMIDGNKILNEYDVRLRLKLLTGNYSEEDSEIIEKTIMNISFYPINKNDVMVNVNGNIIDQNIGRYVELHNQTFFQKKKLNLF